MTLCLAMLPVHPHSLCKASGMGVLVINQPNLHVQSPEPKISIQKWQISLKFSVLADAAGLSRLHHSWTLIAKLAESFDSKTQQQQQNAGQIKHMALHTSCTKLHAHLQSCRMRLPLGLGQDTCSQ